MLFLPADLAEEARNEVLSHWLKPSLGVACEQALRGPLAAGREKEGDFTTCLQLRLRNLPHGRRGWRIRRRAPPPMDLSGSASKVVERWRQWKRSYEYYIDGKRITQAGRKKSQLLHLTGLEVRDIFEDLVDPGPINATTDDVYKVCIRKLYAHFRADGNVPYERHVFRNVVPLSGESADKFLVRLKNRRDIVILARL